jgi:hypothetical protein
MPPASTSHAEFGRSQSSTISGDKNTLFRCTGTGAPQVVRHCAAGCAVHPGSDEAWR